jgi:signal transduction histidine kinase
MSVVSESSLHRPPGGFRGYSAEELTETVRLTRKEDPRWRLVLPVTRGTRDYIIEQMPALVVTYGVAIALILAAASIERVLPPWLVAVWLLESGASIALRMLIFRRMVRASLVEVASSRWLRLLPVFAIVLAAIHWSWTATLFIGPQLTLTTVVMLLTYAMLSIACLSLAPASPVICAAYLVPMWGATAWMLAASEWASGSVLLALAAALAGVLWSGFYIVVSGVRRYLVRSDEVDLLMRELCERNSEVEVLRAAAAADLETRAAVFASASHDLRQRIHALKLLAHTNAADTPPKSPMHRIASVVEELESFVTDVLQFVRFDSGGTAGRLSTVPLQEVLQGIELQFEAVAAERGIRLRTRATPLSIRTDAVMLGRILENLVSNALKFTRQDVLLVARRRGGDVCLEVWDQGVGLEPERLEIGTTTRARPGQRSQHDGFGLGLMIVRRLVEALGYRIEMQSRKKCGTRIQIVVPSKHVVQEEQR